VKALPRAQHLQILLQQCAVPKEQTRRSRHVVAQTLAPVCLGVGLHDDGVQPVARHLHGGGRRRQRAGRDARPVLIDRARQPAEVDRRVDARNASPHAAARRPDAESARRACDATRRALK